MVLAFYKAEYGNILDKLIAWWTRPNFFKFWESATYSHVEMLFSNGESFSSSQRDNGTRWKAIKYDHKWDFVHIPDVNEETIKSLCIREENKRYDWVCLFFSNLFPFNIQHHSKWICSEICSRLVFGIKDSHKYNPQTLYEYTQKGNVCQ